MCRTVTFEEYPNCFNHDRLVGNMLVGAGEIDAAMLVVAADDGPRAQTLEHLALLDALGDPSRHGGRDEDRIWPARADGRGRRAVERLLARTSLAGAPVLAVSAVDGTRDRGAAGRRWRRCATGSSRDPRAELAGIGSACAIDRVFAVKGRGTVVTGTLRGRPVEAGTALRIVPGDRSVRVREVQVHGAAVERAGPGPDRAQPGRHGGPRTPSRPRPDR